jgi:hypothetical protein
MSVVRECPRIKKSRLLGIEERQSRAILKRKTVLEGYTLSVMEWSRTNKRP